MKPPDGYGTTHSTLNGKATHQKRLVIYFRRWRPKCRRTCAALCLCSLIFISNSARLSDEFTRRHPAKNEGGHCGSERTGYERLATVMDCQSGLRRLRQYLCGCACSVRLYGTSKTDGSEIIGLQISSRPRRNRTGRAVSRDFTNPLPHYNKARRRTRLQIAGCLELNRRVLERRTVGKSRRRSIQARRHATHISQSQILKAARCE